MTPPPARCACIKPARRCCADASSVLVGSSSSQIGRVHRDKPGDRQPPALSGRKIGRRQAGKRGKPDGVERFVGSVDGFAPKKPAQKRKFSATESEGFSASWWPR